MLWRPLLYTSRHDPGYAFSARSASGKRGIRHRLGDLPIGCTDRDLYRVVLGAIEPCLGMAVVEKALFAGVTADTTSAHPTKRRNGPCRLEPTDVYSVTTGQNLVFEPPHVCRLPPGSTQI